MKTLVRAPRRLTPVTLALLMLAMVRPASAAGPAVPAGSATTGSLTPPATALRATGMPGSGVHALGFVPNPAAAQPAPSSTRRSCRPHCPRRSTSASTIPPSATKGA